MWILYRDQIASRKIFSTGREAIDFPDSLLILLCLSNLQQLVYPQAALTEPISTVSDISRPVLISSACTICARLSSFVIFFHFKKSMDVEFCVMHAIRGMTPVPLCWVLFTSGEQQVLRGRHDGYAYVNKSAACNGVGNK